MLVRSRKIAALFVSMLICSSAFAQAETVRTPTYSPHLNCEDPAAYICNPSIDPSIGLVSKMLTGFESIKQSALESPELAAFLKKKGGLWAKKCTDLQSYGEIEKCLGIVNTKILSQVDSPERVAKANLIFESAKAAVLSALETRRIEAARLNDPSADSFNRMILFIGKIKLVFNTYHTLKIVSVNSGYDNEHTHNIYAEGGLMMVDYVPEAFYYLLLHELSHSVDPNNIGSPLNLRKNAYPFVSTLRCLRQGNSAHLAVGEECSAPVAAASGDDEGLGVQYVNATGRSCHADQAGEGFADWLATEAFSKALEHRTIPALSAGPMNPLRFFGGYCRTYREFGDVEYSKWFDSHPPQKTRINDIIFANPGVRNAIGCSERPVIEVGVPSTLNGYCK